MTVEVQNNSSQEQKPSDKELNFRALEAKYQKQLEQERSEKLEAQRIAQEILAKVQKVEEDDDDGEPYLDKKKFKKEQAKFGQQIKQETQSDIQKAVHAALAEERKNTWIKNNPDFYETLQNHAEKIVQKDPEFAETILNMPDSFERQKLVYKSVKAMGLDKAETKAPSIQEKIDANRRSPYYQPSGIAAAPYSSAGDFSPAGQKQSYEKMQELKNRMRLG